MTRITALMALLVALAGSAAAQPDDIKIGEFIPTKPPQPAPAVAFTDLDGKPAALADFKGRLVLVNLWATWCQPCLKEMPALDKLAGGLDGKLTVAAISEDRGGAKTVRPFVEKLGLGNLKFYLDPKSEAAHAFAARGLPTSILVDGDGDIVGKVEGRADWDNPEVKSGLDPFLKPK